jgi:predicted secreted hydrolase
MHSFNFSRFFLGLLLACAVLGAWAQPMAQVRPGVAITLPRDHGAHPDFRTEWWYLTGWLQTPKGEDLAFIGTRIRA